MSTSVERIQNIIGYRFGNEELLDRALTHRSAAGLNNERLEFLGDSVLGLLVAAVVSVAQESLNNVLKHSGVSEVELVFDAMEDRALLSVSDAGRGFDPTAGGRRERLGLSIMRDRAATIGATLEIDSAPQQGCRVTMIWFR